MILFVMRTNGVVRMIGSEKKQVLVTWLDHTDLRAMAQCQSKAIQSEIKKIVQDIGPVKGICTIMVLVHAKCSCL